MTLRCQFCSGEWELPNARSERFRLKILFFAQCPHCGSYRDERSKHHPYPRCESCNIPIKVGKYCHAHYVYLWRRMKPGRIKSRTEAALA